MMLPNSDCFICKSSCTGLKPHSDPIKLSSAPYDIGRLGSKEFMVCDSNPSDQHTQLLSITTSGEKTELMSIPGMYERWDYLNDFVLLINREGDITHVNLNTKCVDTVKKQHPGHFVEVIHTDSEFITSGGNVKSLNGDYSERIVKIWGFDADDKLFCKGRFSTGHQRPIEHTLLLNRTSLATLSKDRKINITDLIQEHNVAVIRTGEEEPLSACQTDYNSLLYGGRMPSLSMVDIRSSKHICGRIELKGELVQLTRMTRFSDYEILLCNVNNLELLDMRMLQVRTSRKVEGETNWAVKILNQSLFAIGNREKFVQIWETQ